MCGVVALSFAAFVSDRATPTTNVTLRLIDAESGRERPGIVRFLLSDGTVHHPTELQCRGLGLSDKLPITEWFTLPQATKLRLPRNIVAIEATSGLEWEMTRQEIDLSTEDRDEIQCELKRFVNWRDAGWRSGNTHIHLMKISREESDRYLRDVPRADGLDAVFVSYLERAVADQEYITNRYSRDDLAEIGRSVGIAIGNGEEHRHNFEGFGQGYGHVMLLDLPEWVQPVSIGPGIMKMGTDGLPLQRGIDNARRQNATILWCHNRWGIEAPANFLTGRVSAMNIFDGGPHGSFKDSYYRYWNCGLPVSFSTGTDWFIYDFSRVYARVDGDVTVKNWLKALREGKTFITNGPLLKMSVNRTGPGDSVAIHLGERVRIEGEAVGRSDFGRIELVRNGAVIAKSESRKVGRHFESRISLEVGIDAPCWLALRTPPPPVKDDPTLQEPVKRNDFDQEIFAHTTPVSVTVDGKTHFDRAVAEGLLDEMNANVKMIEQQAKFADDAERQRVLDVHRDGIAALRRRIARNGP